MVGRSKITGVRKCFLQHFRTFLRDGNQVLCARLADPIELRKNRFRFFGVFQHLHGHNLAGVLIRQRQRRGITDVGFDFSRLGTHGLLTQNINFFRVNIREDQVSALTGAKQGCQSFPAANIQHRIFGIDFKAFQQLPRFSLIPAAVDCVQKTDSPGIDSFIFSHSFIYRAFSGKPFF